MAIRRFIVDSGGTSRRILRRFVVDSGGVSRRIRRRFVIDSGGVARQTYDGNLRWVTQPTVADGICQTGGCPGTPCVITTDQPSPAPVVESGTGSNTYSWAYVSGNASWTVSDANIASPTWSHPACNNGSQSSAVWRLTVDDGVTSVTADVTVTGSCETEC